MPRESVLAIRPSYVDTYASFDIETAKIQLQGDLDRGVNACIECCDRHCGEDLVALRCVSTDDAVTEYTFEQLRELTAKTANILRALGVGSGDVVAGMMPRTVELMAVVLGTWRLGAVYQPLFTAFGPKAIEQRLQTSNAKILVTNSANRHKLDEVPNCPLVALVRNASEHLPSGDVDFRAGIGTADATFEPVMRQGNDLFMLMSTSGTTGLPKGVPVPLSALLSFRTYMTDAIDLRADDIFWNIADPGWAYGLYYAVCGPLLLGCATTLYEGPFTADSTYRIIQRLGVTSLAGSPTAYRLLLAAGPDAALSCKGKLRVVSSAGEPLNPAVIRWFAEHLSAPIYDHYGQTELGMCVNNHHRLQHPIRAGSAGVAMPGYRVVVLDDEGNELGPNKPGILAVDTRRSPILWFRGYLNQETPAIAGGYYRTGDNVEAEPDGSISFIGRADDVITSAGYRIGPFDVESALLEHPAVVETAVVGVPDPERTEIIKAFVVLKKGVEGTHALRDELQALVKRRLSAHAYPRLIDFVAELPKTPSGKIQRFILRRAEAEKQVSPRSEGRSA